MKQSIFATMLLVALPAMAAAQDAQPLDARACQGNITDIKGCVTAPKLTYSPKPKYPKSERKARHEGVVKLHLVVGADGDASNIVVWQTLSPDFDQSAIEAVKQWKFNPATKEGRPVSVWIAVEVEFNLNR